VAKIRIEGDPAELAEKSAALLKSIATALETHDPVAASAVVSALDALPKGRRTRYRNRWVTIEHEAGSVRSWPNGSTRMQHPYGYMHAGNGSDGEGYDCYLGPDKTSPKVFVVQQLKPSGEYDEDKAFLGWSCPHEVKNAYVAHRNDGERAFGGLTEMTWEEFEQRLDGLKCPTSDGMLKAQTAQPAPEDKKPRVRFTMKSPVLCKAPRGSLSVEFAAINSQMGARAVSQGASGLNIQVHSPVQLKPENTRDAREKLDEQRDTEEELAYARSSHKKRKEGLKQLAVDDRVQPVHPVEEYETGLQVGREEANKEALAAAPENIDHLRARAVTRATGGAINKPAVSLSFQGSKKTRGRGRPPRAKIRPGIEVAIEKPGLGSVSLKTIKDSRRPFGVQLGDSWHTFRSLSSACDFVWCRQNGYKDAQVYKSETGRKKVPSGAGWKFWGIDPAEVV
jgi:hypothetical protein